MSAWHQSITLCYVTIVMSFQLTHHLSGIRNVTNLNYELRYTELTQARTLYSIGAQSSQQFDIHLESNLDT